MRKRLSQAGPVLAALAGLAGCAAPADPDREDYRDRVRVACVGDSITWGAGVGDRTRNSYPAQLARMLGGRWGVRNFGVSGATVLKKGDKPYWQEEAFRRAQDFDPNVVVILLGTNDTKPQNREHKGDFAADYRELVEQFAGLPGRPRVFVCRPAPVPRGGNSGINERGVREEIPIIDRVARETGAGVIDVHAALEGRPDLLPDNVHPNAEGARLIARAVCQALTAGEGSAGGR